MFLSDVHHSLASFIPPALQKRALRGAAMEEDDPRACSVSESDRHLRMNHRYGRRWADGWPTITRPSFLGEKQTEIKRGFIVSWGWADDSPCDNPPV